MSRFEWPLQRLLDVTVQRESAARMELSVLADRLAAAQDHAAEQTHLLRQALADLARLCIEDRVARAPVLVHCIQRRQKGIDEWREQCRQILQAKHDKIAEVVQIRNSRQTLERMRDEAHARYQREQLILEQKQFDETAQIAFARDQIQQRRDRITGARP